MTTSSESRRPTTRPGLAILCFFGAAAGGLWLLAHIFLQDSRKPGKRGPGGRYR